MNKPEQNLGSAGDGMSTEMITEIMADPAFTAEQLPGLWQQIADPAATLDDSVFCGWRDGLEALYRACETYPQHTRIVAALDGLPSDARRHDDWIRDQASDLLRCAAPEQLMQALTYEQHPDGWLVSSHILHFATVEQLTGPVIERFRWNPWLTVWVNAGYGPSQAEPQLRHIVDHIRQRLLAGDRNAWTVFLGIAETGMVIGETAKLAAAIEHGSGSA